MQVQNRALLNGNVIAGKSNGKKVGDIITNHSTLFMDLGEDFLAFLIDEKNKRELLSWLRPVKVICFYSGFLLFSIKLKNYTVFLDHLRAEGSQGELL